MTDEEYILKLIFRAFLDIRIDSYEKKNYPCFILADVFHNVPINLLRASQGEMSYAAVIAQLRAKCEARNALGWLENATNDLSRRHSSEE